MMNISLTPELEKYIHEKVDRGFYSSVSEVIRESLRLMHNYDSVQKQRMSEMNRAIETGLAQLNAGEKIPAAESYERLKKKIDAIAKNK